MKSGSSYLSQSELPVTFGLGKRDKIDRLVIEWPSGRTEEYKNLAAGRAYECVESKGITRLAASSIFQYCGASSQGLVWDQLLTSRGLPRSRS